uniref:Uncharacterized protein n=1 Tax=Eutreptiella gymnastica TaxID=73025 RepID=A0A7S4FR46_9EUGL
MGALLNVMFSRLRVHTGMSVLWVLEVLQDFGWYSEMGEGATLASSFSSRHEGHIEMWAQYITWCAAYCRPHRLTAMAGRKSHGNSAGSESGQCSHIELSTELVA